MPSYTVAVKVKLIEFYRVEADSPAEAAENRQEGSFIASDDSHLDAEPVKVTQGPTTVWRRL